MFLDIHGKTCTKHCRWASTFFLGLMIRHHTPFQEPPHRTCMKNKIYHVTLQHLPCFRPFSLILPWTSNNNFRNLPHICYCIESQIDQFIHSQILLPSRIKTNFSVSIVCYGPNWLFLLHSEQMQIIHPRTNTWEGVEGTIMRSLVTRASAATLTIKAMSTPAPPRLGVEGTPSRFLGQHSLPQGHFCTTQSTHYASPTVLCRWGGAHPKHLSSSCTMLQNAAGADADAAAYTDTHLVHLLPWYLPLSLLSQARCSHALASALESGSWSWASICSSCSCTSSRPSSASSSWPPGARMHAL